MGISNFQDGTLCHINFCGAYDGEIKDIHLAVLFSINGVENLAFCIPLTSPKLKHFKTEKNFNDRNYLETKSKRLHYIKQTDSIALLEQFGCISSFRIANDYKDEDDRIVVLQDDELDTLKQQTLKYIKNVEACVEFVGRIMGHEIKNQRANEVSLL